MRPKILGRQLALLDHPYRVLATPEIVGACIVGPESELAERTPKSEWRWQLLIRISEAVTETHLKQARAEIRKRRDQDTSAVRRWNWAEGRCLQVMHVGPYDEVGKVYRSLDEFAAAAGLATACPGHEIYISDPRRVAPDRLKTIARLPVKKNKGLSVVKAESAARSDVAQR